MPPNKIDTTIHDSVNILHPSRKCFCIVCDRNISQLTIIMAEGKYYCVSCFANLDTIPAYYIMTNLKNLKFGDWTARQQLLMLEGLQKQKVINERYNFGNWKQIASHVETKDPEQVRERYLRFYLTQSFPRKHQLNIPNQVKKKKQKKQLKIVKEEKKQKKQRGLIGYNSRRQQFQIQYDNEAEQILSELQFLQTDTEDEQKMKLRLIEIYNRRLDERNKRKRFVIERELFKANPNKTTNIDKQQQKIVMMLRPFARFQTPEEHQTLTDQVIKERKIRTIIEELKIMKKKGIKNLNEVEQAIKVKNKKDPSYKKGGSRRSLKKDKEEMIVKSLHRSEQQLCRQKNILIEEYMGIRAAIMRESVEKRILNKQQICSMFNVKRDVIVKIIDKLVQLQLIVSPK